jgi:hypothetical protein
MHKMNIAPLRAMALFTAVILTPDSVHAQTDACDVIYGNTIPNIPKACVGKATSSLALKSPQCTPVTCPKEYKEEYNGCLRDEYSRATKLKVSCEKSQLRAPLNPEGPTLECHLLSVLHLLPNGDAQPWHRRRDVGQRLVATLGDSPPLMKLLIMQ